MGGESDLPSTSLSVATVLASSASSTQAPWHQRQQVNEVMGIGAVVWGEGGGDGDGLTQDRNRNVPFNRRCLLSWLAVMWCNIDAVPGHLPVRIPTLQLHVIIFWLLLSVPTALRET